MLNPPLMYSDLWNNQRRRKWRHLNNSIYLLLFSGSVSLFSAAFHNERHLPCPFLFFIFCTAALNHKMKHIGCSVTGILWYLMYRKCRRAIHMEQSELKECQPPFCSLCWCQFWSLWSFKLCWLYYHSLYWSVCWFSTALYLRVQIMSFCFFSHLTYWSYSDQS